MILNISILFLNVFILEVRVECFIKGKWGFAFDCRSLQIRWFLSDYTQCWLSGDTVSLFISNDQLRWQMASAGWQVGDGEIGSWKTRQEK